MKSVSESELAATAIDLMRSVEQGEEILITRDGAPFARIVPVARAAQDFEAARERMRARRQRLSLGGLSLRDLIDEGRR